MSEHEIVIDLDKLREDPEVLARLYECASLMVQSDHAGEVETGYNMLEMVDRVLKER